MIKTILFDLDGTLLPMNQDLFIETYLTLMAKKLAPFGYDPKVLPDSIWKGCYAMIKNDGSCPNKDLFWKTFCEIHGEHASKDEPLYEEFYRTDFQKAAEVCGFHPMAAEILREIQKKDLRAVLATNPVFPTIATHSRVRWAGLEPDDFVFITTYENSSFCKPNLDYYREILGKLNLKAEECLMVGNDVSEDMIAAQLGMQVFLLTDCIINKHDLDISVYPHGGFSELMNYIRSL